MRFEWDKAKSLANRAKHGIGFDAIERFDWDSALEFIDDREDYGELREVAISFIGVRLYYLAFLTNDDGTVRVCEAHCAGETDSVLLPLGHTRIGMADAMIRQVLHFVRHGRFSL